GGGGRGGGRTAGPADAGRRWRCRRGEGWRQWEGERGRRRVIGCQSESVYCLFFGGVGDAERSCRLGDGTSRGALASVAAPASAPAHVAPGHDLGVQGLRPLAGVAPGAVVDPREHGAGRLDPGDDHVQGVGVRQP
ncbi:hypothetical protein EG861_14530, partial [Enterococcus faecalis]